MASSSSSKNSTTKKTGTGTTSTSKVDPADPTQIDDTPKPTGGKIYFEVDKPSDKMFSSVLKPLDSVSDGGFAISYISEGYSIDGLADNLCDSYWLDSVLPILDDADKADDGLSDFGKWIQYSENRGLKVHAYAPGLDGLRNVWTYEQYRQNETGKINESCDEYTTKMIDSSVVHDYRSDDEKYEFTGFPWKRLPAGAYIFCDGGNYTQLINAYRVVQHYGFSLGVLIEHPNDGYLATAQSFKSKKDPSLYIMGYAKKKASAADFPKDEFDGYYWQTTSKTGDVRGFGGEDFHGLLNRYNEPVPLIPVDPINSKPAKATKKAYVGLGYDHKLKSGQTLGYSPDGNSKHFKAAVTPWGFTFQQYDAARMWRLLKPYIIESAESMQGRQGNPGKNGVSPTIDKATKHWLLGDIDTGVVAQGKDGKDGKQGNPGKPGPAGAPGKAGKDGKDGDSPDINEAGNWVIGGKDTGIRAEGMPGADGATPMIDPSTKHWLIDGADTGIVAQGVDGTNGHDGKNGVSPVIDPKTYHWTINGNDTGVIARGVNGKDGKNGTKIWHAANTKITPPIWGSWYTDLEQVSTTNLPVVGDLVITADGSISQVSSTASTTDGNVLHGSFNTDDVIGNVNGKTGQRGSLWWTTTVSQPYRIVHAPFNGSGIVTYQGKTSTDLGIKTMTTDNPPQVGDMLLSGNGDVYQVYDFQYSNGVYNLTFTRSGINLKS